MSGNNSAYPPDARDSKTSQSHTGLKPDTLSRNTNAGLINLGLKPDKLSRYTYERNITDLSIHSKRIRNVVDRIHESAFVKPAGEECVKRFPSAILIGVDKCGTNELTEFLHMHPLVEIYSRRNEVGSPIYEMDYFGRNYSSGIDWFRDQMPCSYSNQMTFMKQSTYFARAETPERIYNFNPNIKLILMVREPVARSIARFMMEVQMTWIKPGTALEDVIFQNGTINERHNILKHSSYDESMKSWLKYFSSSQIMVIESEEFKHKPGEILFKVEEFLGLPHAIKPETFVWNDEKGFYCLKTDIDPSGVACYGANRGKTLIDISVKTKAFLVEYFKSKNRNFFDLIGRKYDNWSV